MKKLVPVVICMFFAACKSAPEVKEEAAAAKVAATAPAVQTAPVEAAGEAAGIAIDVKDTPPLNALCIEYTGSYGLVGKLFESLSAFTGQKSIKITGAPFGMYYDDPAQTPPEKLRADVCVPIEGVPEVTLPMKVKSFPPQKVASTVFKGPMHEAAKALPPVFDWMAKNSWKPAGPVIETYLDDPGKVKPEEQRTEIWVPITK